MTHANARTTVYARQLMVTRHQAGWRPARIAEQLGVSRATVYKWLSRYDTHGVAGLADRSSRPHHSPTRLDPATEDRILQLREQARRGPVYLARQLGLAASTVGRVLRRHQVPHLAAIDAITGQPVRRRHSERRYQRHAPGDLLHIDVKKLGRVPDGGGWRVHGRSEAVRGRGMGYDYLHVAIDDYTRLAYVEALPDEKDPTCAGFLHRAVAWFREQSVVVLRILTDNAKVYRLGSNWRAVCVALACGGGSSGRAVRGPTARRSGSTGPCKPSSLTPGPGAATSIGWMPCQAGSRTTTLSGLTPLWQVIHRSPDSPGDCHNLSGHYN